MNFLLQRLLTAVLLTFVSSTTFSVLAHDHKMMASVQKTTSPTVKVHRPWARALPPMAVNGAAYLMIHNEGNSDDAILQINSPIADSVMIHQNVVSNGNVMMKHVGYLPLKGHGMVQFTPGGFHVMLKGLKKPLVAGESFPITVMMEKAGEIHATVQITQGNGNSESDNEQTHKHNH